jgi:hypothetical protein
LSIKRFVIWLLLFQLLTCRRGTMHHTLGRQGDNGTA